LQVGSTKFERLADEALHCYPRSRIRFQRGFLFKNRKSLLLLELSGKMFVKNC